MSALFTYSLIEDSTVISIAKVSRRNFPDWGNRQFSVQEIKDSFWIHFMGQNAPGDLAL